jgi:hypothetical protein
VEREELDLAVAHGARSAASAGRRERGAVRGDWKLAADIWNDEPIALLG